MLCRGSIPFPPALGCLHCWLLRSVGLAHAAPPTKHPLLLHHVLGWHCRRRRLAVVLLQLLPVLLLSVLLLVLLPVIGWLSCGRRWLGGSGGNGCQDGFPTLQHATEVNRRQETSGGLGRLLLLLLLLLPG